MHRLEESTAEIDVFEALLERPEPAISWGLTFTGGKLLQTSLKVSQVSSGGPADRIGLKPGDEVTEIGDKVTSSMTHDEAHALMQQYGLSLILTVERRASKVSHVTYNSPTAQAVSHDETLKGYQPYDLTGGRVHHQPAHAKTYEFKQVVGRPFEAPPPRYHMTSPVPSSPSPTTNQSQPNNHHNAYSREPQSTMQYIPVENTEEADYSDGASQSRTFKMLQGLMANEEQSTKNPVLVSKTTPVIPQPVPLEDHTAAPPTGSEKYITHKQFNTPAALYNQNAVTHHISNKLHSVNLNDNQEREQSNIVVQSDVLRLVQEMDKEKKTQPCHQRPVRQMGHSKIKTDQTDVARREAARFAKYGLGDDTLNERK